jgi:hypothetical protein
MIRKGGYRFSDKIMFNPDRKSGPRMGKTSVRPSLPARRGADIGTATVTSGDTGHVAQRESTTLTW